MINIPTFLVEQAKRRLASIRASIRGYRDDVQEAEQRAEAARRAMASAERDEVELSAWLAQIGEQVPPSPSAEA